MPRANLIQPSFSSGEVSPFVAGRVDAKVYANGLRTCENFIIRPQGAASFRGGTKLIGPTKFHDKTARFVDFIFSDVQAYVLEFGHNYIHLHKNGEKLMETTESEVEAFETANSGGFTQIVTDETPWPHDLPVWGPAFTFLGSPQGADSDNGTVALSNNGGLVRVTTSVPHTLRTGAYVFMVSTEIAGIHNLQFTVTWISPYVVDLQGSTYSAPGAGSTVMFSHGVLAGDRIYISGAADYPSIGEQHHLVHNVDDYYRFTLATKYVNHGGSPSMEEAWTIPIEIVTEYTESHLDELSFAQSADVLYIMHPDFPTMKLTRLDNDGDRLDWLLAEVVFTDGPYLPLQDSAPNVDTVTPANGSLYLDAYLDLTGYTHTATLKCSPIPATLSDSGGNYLVTTSIPHGLASTNLIVIAGTGTTADGNRVATVVSATTFTIATAFGSVGVAGTATPAFATGDDSLYIEYREGDQWRLAQLPSTMSNYDVTATVTIVDNVLLHLDETTKFTNTIGRNGRRPQSRGFGSLFNVTYDAGSPNASPSVPMAGVRQRVDPNNSLISAELAAGAGLLTSNYSNTFGPADVGKYVRYMNSLAHAASAGRVALWAQIVRITSGANTANHSAAVTMATINSAGAFVISSHSRTGTITARRNAAVFAIFASTDVWRHIRLGWGGRWTWGVISAFTSTSVVTVTLYDDVPRDPHNAANLAGAPVGAVTVASSLVTGLNSGRTYDWRLGAWSDTTGYPSVACFHEQRLCFGRTNTQPASFWGSVTGDFENMRPTELDSTVLDDNALNFTLASGRVNAIKWMESGSSLVIGTNGGEWLVRSSSVAQEPITPTNISVTEQSRNGSAILAKPLRIGNAIAFVDRSERKVMEVSYLFSEDRLADKDLTIVSEHILRLGGTVVQTAFQKNPHCIAWFCLSDGSLAAMTYNQEQEVIAWHRHELGGGGLVESICVVPSEDGTHDDIYMLVNRTISGSTKRTVEMLTAEFYPSGSSRLGMTFVDGCVVIDNALTVGTTSVKGLWHLEGKTVTAVVDGVLRGTFTVASGAITLTGATPVSEVVVGMAYTGTIKSLPPEGGSPGGTSQGMKKRIVEMKVRVFNTFDFNFGWQADLVAKDISALTTVRTETTLPYFTGTVPVVPKNPYDEESPWTITQDKPYPCNILAVVSVVETNQ